MAIGLVLEGGAMRGMFTAGVTDVFMENGIEFDGAMGTSAGAVFGCNYKSKQIGRTIRYNTKYCRDSRYVGLKNLILTGDLYGKDFAYNELPNKLDIFDTDTFKNSPMEFYVVATDVETGEAVYHKCTDGGERDTTYMRASASMPLVSRIVEIDGKKMLDGGMADSIAIREMERMGYTKNVIILTQPIDFVKEPNKMLPLMGVKYRKYPEFIKSLETRHNRYNETISYIKEGESAGSMFVIRPESSLNIGAMERNPDELLRVYQAGREIAINKLNELKEFMKR